MTKKIAFLFPGQGSQSVGMLSDLAKSDPLVQETFGEASEVLGFDLWQLVQEGPAEQLNRTDRTQPAMLAAGVAVWRVWQAQGGPSPAWLAGHSLGEFSALVCAEALAFPDAVQLVAQRGALMQAAVPSGAGAMAAILGLGDAQVQAVCREAAQGDVLEAVNFNAPGQVVIAGTADAVERGMQLAKAQGAKRVVRLPVSVPSHCALMRPAAAQFSATLETVPFNPPRIPVLHNVTVAPAAEPSEIRRLLSQQLYSPVRWVETIQRLPQEGVNVLLEAGPGKVLTGLAKRIDRRLTALALFDPEGLHHALEITAC